MQCSRTHSSDCTDLFCTPADPVKVRFAAPAHIALRLAQLDTLADWVHGHARRLTREWRRLPTWCV